MDKWQLESRTQQLSTEPAAHGLFAVLPQLILIPLTPLPPSILVNFISTTRKFQIRLQWPFNLHNTLNA